MKKYLLAISLFATVLPASAASLYHQLRAVNSRWSSAPSVFSLNEENNFSSDRSLVQAHFAAVENVLRAADVSALTPAQLAERKRNIQVLHDYAARGIFPSNIGGGCRAPVFIDGFGTHCAVGHLMQQSGNEALAVRISSRNNLVYAIDINDPEIYAWQETSGFTMEELALIQPTYDFIRPDPEPPVEAAEYACDTVYFDASKTNIYYAGACSNGQLDGKWQQYFAPGRVSIDGQFKQGKKTGTWTYYWAGYSPGAIKQRQETWTDGKLNGMYVMYDVEGQKSSEGMYENNLKTGLWRNWIYGYLAIEENYVAGKLHGKRTLYHIVNDGAGPKTQAEELYEDGIQLTRKSFDSNGKLIDSLHLYYNGEKSMLKARTSYSATLGFDSISYTCVKQGQCETEVWSYNTKGQLTRHMRTRVNGTTEFLFTYMDGKLHDGTRYYANGVIAERWQRDESGSGILSYQQMSPSGKELTKGSCMNTDTALRCSVWKFHNSNGGLAAKGEYLDGIQKGVWEYYDAKGTLTAKGEYVNGVKEGMWTETYPDGTVWTGAYTNGKKTGTWTGPKIGKRKVRKEKF